MKPWVGGAGEPPSRLGSSSAHWPRNGFRCWLWAEGAAQGDRIGRLALRSVLLFLLLHPYTSPRKLGSKGVPWGCRSLEHGLPMDARLSLGLGNGAGAFHSLPRKQRDPRGGVVAQGRQELGV